MLPLTLGFFCIVCGMIVGLTGALYYLDMPLSYFNTQNNLNSLNANFDKEILENEKQINNLKTSYSEMNHTLYDIADQNDVNLDILDDLAKKERLLVSKTNNIKTQDYLNMVFNKDTTEIFDNIKRIEDDIETQYDKIDAPKQNVESMVKIINRMFELKNEISSLEKVPRNMQRDMDNMEEEIVMINEKWEHSLNCLTQCPDEPELRLDKPFFILVIGMSIMAGGIVAIRYKEE